MSGERTEDATPKRRADARKRGQVARSTEVTAMASLLGGLALLHMTGGAFLFGIAQIMRHTFSHLPTSTPMPNELRIAGLNLALQVLGLMAPLFAGLMVIGLVANVSQVGFLFSTRGVKPDPKRINPAQGFKRLLGTRAWVELVKSLVKLTIVGLVTYQVMQEHYQTIVMMTGSNPVAAASLTATAMFALVLKAGGGLLVLALLDYAYQRWQHNRSLRMTRQEVRDEHKLSEGDPQLKARIRRTQRQMAMRRMMQAVPTADVILTNPTHIAVAMKYDPSSMDAPTVVAKGEELMAERIKVLAAEHGVPIIENKPLARALYAACEVDERVPPALFQAVAEVLAFLYSMQRGYARPTATSSLTPA